jgi:hypothetical protein
VCSLPQCDMKDYSPLAGWGEIDVKGLRRKSKMNTIESDKTLI